MQKKNMHPKVHSSIVYNSQLTEATQGSTKRWRGEEDVEYYSGIKKERNFAICSDMDGLGGYSAQWNKLSRERQILYDITYIWNLKNKN